MLSTCIVKVSLTGGKLSIYSNSSKIVFKIMFEIFQDSSCMFKKFKIGLTVRDIK